MRFRADLGPKFSKIIFAAAKLGPFQNKGDFRKSKDALGREISVRNCTTFGHMAPAASEKNVIFDNFYVEVGIAVYTCRCCFCAKSAPPDPHSMLKRVPPPDPHSMLKSVAECPRLPRQALRSCPNSTLIGGPGVNR